jgi:hypothetical protein
MDDVYFFDSYAVMEIIKGNLNYEKYTNAGIVLTKENVFEIYFNVLRKISESAADEILEEFYPFVIDFDKEVIKEAALFRSKYYKKDISMTDCIGYILALKLGIKFLTGDKEFIDFENVEFVK